MEIMVVLILISIVAGVSTSSLIPFYRTYRFRTEVNSLYDLAQELQLEALTLQSDMKINFTKKNGKWMAKSLTDEVILKSQTIDLSHVDNLYPDESLTLTFYSNGLVEPRTVVSLHHKNEKRGLDLTQSPLIKFWVGSPQQSEKLQIPKRDVL
jgi:type II secretory pathway pseudopilin PulG